VRVRTCVRESACVTESARVREGERSRGPVDNIRRSNQEGIAAQVFKDAELADTVVRRGRGGGRWVFAKGTPVCLGAH
jgi:hypothetical protein